MDRAPSRLTSRTRLLTALILATSVATHTLAAPLAESRDSYVAVALESVIVRNGPEAWTEDALWDEYRFRVRSLSGGNVRVTRVMVFDALGKAVESSGDRHELIKATAEVNERYRTSTIVKVTEGVLGTTASTTVRLAAGFVPMLGMLVIFPSLSKLDDNIQKSSELGRRQTKLPADIAADDVSVVAFFPVVPAPMAAEISYSVGSVEHSVRIANPALSQIHLVVDHHPKPTFPAEAIRRGFNSGYVRASLSIDGSGRVSDVKVLQSSAPFFVDEAVHTFRNYKYMPGNGRKAEEVIRFKRGTSP
jgi:hypothetical protein